jgi:hypothetical protein
MLAGFVCLAWTVWPLPQKSQTLTLTGPAADMMDEAQRQAAAGIKSWRITVQKPLFLRIDEAARVSLTVEAVPDPSQALLEPQYQLEAEARCDLVGMQHTPLGDIQTALLPGDTLHFDWQVTASQPGSVTGVVWFYLEFVSLPGSQAKVLPPLPLSAQEITLRPVSLAGMNVAQARLLGLIGLISGFGLLAVKL